MSDVAPMIATIVMMFVIGWSIKFVGSNRRLDRLAKMHNELQHKILDKFGSTAEMIEYLETDPGKRLLDAPVIERGSPYGRILGSVQAGIILVLAGGAFLVVTRMVQIGDVGDEVGFVFVGVLGLALGIGFLVSAYAAHVLSKSYGLINGHRSESGI
jgi:hypothetical protein